MVIDLGLVTPSGGMCRAASKYKPDVITMQGVPDVVRHGGPDAEHGGRGDPAGLAAAGRGLRTGLRQRIPTRNQLRMGRQELPCERDSERTCTSVNLNKYSKNS